MRTVSIRKLGRRQVIPIPADMEFQGVSELEIIKTGDTITLRPVRPTWSSLVNSQKVDADFLQDRSDVISSGGRLPVSEQPPKSTAARSLNELGPKDQASQAGSHWGDWFEGEKVSSDFMTNRGQPPCGPRDTARSSQDEEL